MRRRRRLNGVFDDMYASAAGAASTVANDAESALRWGGQELNDLDQTLLGPLSAQGAINAANADAAPGGGGYMGIPGAIQNDIIAPIQNEISNSVGFAVSAFDTVLMLAAAGALIFFALEEK